MVVVRKDELYHSGRLGMQWGVRNGPPYPLDQKQLSAKEKQAQHKTRDKVKENIQNTKVEGNKYSRSNKQHHDFVMDKKTTKLVTLSYNKNRTKDTDMFYATNNFLDNNHYNFDFNRPTPSFVKDENGKSLGSSIYCKFKITNGLSENMNVASEDSGARIFDSLFKKNKDFREFVSDSSRMPHYFDISNALYKDYYQDMKKSMEKASQREQLSKDDMMNLYRLFNYMIPYDGRGNKKIENDMLRNRARFFKACKDAGYGAILDVNDALNGGHNTHTPVIVFDMESVVPQSVKRTTIFGNIKAAGVEAFNKLYTASLNRKS